MDVGFLIKGLIIGFSIAVPIGPISILCIKITLTKGRSFGLISGLGAATADAVYGCIAAFGLTFISNILIGQQIWLRLIGGVFLCFLGIRTFRAMPSERAASRDVKGLLNTYASTFFLTITNPMTILSFAAILAGIDLGNPNGNYGLAASTVLGVFLGSALWWLILSEGVGFFQNKITLNELRWVNRISGIMLTGFGIIVLLDVIIELFS